MRVTLWFLALVFIQGTRAYLSDVLDEVSSITITRAPGGKPTLLCRVILMNTAYQDGNEDEQPSCIPVAPNGRESFRSYRLDVSKAFLSPHLKKLTLGLLYVSIEGAELGEHQLQLEPGASMTVVDPPPPPDKRSRDLVETQDFGVNGMGVKTLLVVRLSVADASPKTSLADLETLFAPGVSFASQYAQCSFGQLTWVSLGVVDVHLHNRTIAEYAADARGGTGMVLDSLTQLHKEVAYLENPQDLADKVFFCIPSGTGNWAASAGVGWWRGQFNDQGGWCTSLSGLIHETGHLLGLVHSSEEGEGDYGDKTGYMGSGHGRTDWPQKCFNGHKHWLLGWFALRHIVIEPISQGALLFKIAAFVDFHKATEWHDFVIVNVGNKYFLQYNRAKSFNIDTEEYADALTITEDAGAVSVGRGGLYAGEVFVDEDYLGTGLQLWIQVCATVPGNETTPDTIYVSIGIGTTLCINPDAVSAAANVVPTTRAPVAAPSSAPSAYPSAFPTRAPLAFPLLDVMPPSEAFTAPNDDNTSGESNADKAKSKVGDVLSTVSPATTAPTVPVPEPPVTWPPTALRLSHPSDKFGAEDDELVIETSAAPPVINLVRLEALCSVAVTCMYCFTLL